METDQTERKCRQSNRRAKLVSLKNGYPSMNAMFHTIGNSQSRLSRNMTLLHTNPNVYLVKNFLTALELNWFDTLCTEHERLFRNSFTEGADSDILVSDERTSTFFHLSKSHDATIRRIESRAADLLCVGSDVIEPLQIVSYRKGQKFDLHHDAGTMISDSEIELIHPRRLATFFVYLNTLPEGQGHTEFPSLSLSVSPQAGSALLFCNVLPSGEPDPRTVHKACPVGGDLQKFGLNIWVTDTNLQEFALEKEPSLVIRPTSKRRRIEEEQYPVLSAFERANRATMAYLAVPLEPTTSIENSHVECFTKEQTINSVKEVNGRIVDKSPALGAQELAAQEAANSSIGAVSELAHLIGSEIAPAEESTPVISSERSNGLLQGDDRSLVSEISCQSPTEDQQ